jgi:NTE family protein
MGGSGPHRQADVHQLGVVLAGGGARAAYQAGVLHWIAQRYPDLQIRLWTGVSAGAINAAFLANHEGSLREATESLSNLWATLKTESVVRVHTPALASQVMKWGLQFLTGGTRALPQVRGMVDTEPLRQLLCHIYDADGSFENELPGIGRKLLDGRLEALAVTTTDYTTGEAVTFVQGRELGAWERPMRRSESAVMTVDHILASTAVPLFFPAVQIGNSWHGDGGIRQTAPLSPALHLGARRILAIATRRALPKVVPATQVIGDYPAPARILGLLMNTMFLDMLDHDAAYLTRINQLLDDSPQARAHGFSKVDLLVLRPSQDLAALAADYEFQLPGAFKYLTRGWGTRQTPAPDSLAMLLFESGYTTRLLEIGEADAAANAEEIASFLEDPVSRRF